MDQSIISNTNFNISQKIRTETILILYIKIILLIKTTKGKFNE